MPFKLIGRGFMLKNVTRIKTIQGGLETTALIDDLGMQIDAYTSYSKSLQRSGKSESTKIRYLNVVASFIDYLIEAKVFGVGAPKNKINEVIDFYPIFLKLGSKEILGKKSKIFAPSEDAWIAEIAAVLEKKPLAPNSFANTIAALNDFLELSERLSREAFEVAQSKGIYEGSNHSALIKALEKPRTLSLREVSALKQNSMLGALVIKANGKRIKRPQGIAAHHSKNQIGATYLDIPFGAVPAIIENASSWRDKTLWLLMACSGIRISEALNLRWVDIDLENRCVYVMDPSNRRFSNRPDNYQKQKFKGRATSITYLIEPYKSMFFNSLSEYLKNEYLVGSNFHESFVFQYIHGVNRGKPYFEAHHKAISENFQRACKRASIFPPSYARKRMWTIHSLRHMYGVYVKNYLPVDPDKQIYGLSLVEVQKLMGHKSIDSTAHYARDADEIISKKLERADRFINLFEPGLLELFPNLLTEGQ